MSNTAEKVKIDEISDIRAKRISLGIPQWFAARYIGISWTAFQRWENGITKVTDRDRLDRLRELLSGNVEIPEDAIRNRKNARAEKA